MRHTWLFLPVGAWSGKHWYGRKQVEDKSPENIRDCYRYLRTRPYLSAEDQQRLRELELIRTTEAELLR